MRSYLQVFIAMRNSNWAWPQVMGLRGFGHNSTAGVQAGLDYTFRVSPIANYYVGITAAKELTDHSSLRTGLFSSGSGADLYIIDAYNLDTFSEKVRVFSLQLPVDYVYKSIINNFIINKKIYFIGGIGMYISKAILGNEIGHGIEFQNGSAYTIALPLQIHNQDEHHFFPDTIRPVDFGFRLLAGLGFEQWELMARFSEGLSDVPAKLNPYRMHNKNLAFIVSISYWLFTHYK